MTPAPIHRHRAIVQPAWVDYNDHMNVAFYVQVFDQASDVLFDQLGIGKPYAQASRGMIFVVEAHVTYDRELIRHQTLSVSSQLLGRDEKRLRFFHRMWGDPADGGAPYLAATLDSMALHVDPATRRVSPFPPDRAEAIEALWREHRILPLPERAGRSIATLAD